MTDGFKICPYCANEIKKEAIKCQYCHERLNKEETEDKPKNSYRISKPMSKEFIGKKRPSTETIETNTSNSENTSRSHKVEKGEIVKENKFLQTLKKYLKKIGNGILYGFVGLGLLLKRLFKHFWVCVILAVIILIIATYDDSSSNKVNAPTVTQKENTTPNVQPKQETKINLEPELTYTRQANGTKIKVDYDWFARGGTASVKIDNTRSDTDAVFKLVPSSLGKSVYTVYIRGGQTVEIEDIPQGLYYEYFSSSRGKDQFGRLDTYGASKIGATGKSKGLPSSYENGYQRTITLYKTTSGNVSSESVSDSTFDDL